MRKANGEFFVRSPPPVNDRGKRNVAPLGIDDRTNHLKARIPLQRDAYVSAGASIPPAAQRCFDRRSQSYLEDRRIPVDTGEVPLRAERLESDGDMQERIDGDPLVQRRPQRNAARVATS